MGLGDIRAAGLAQGSTLDRPSGRPAAAYQPATSKGRRPRPAAWSCQNPGHCGAVAAAAALHAAAKHAGDVTATMRLTARRHGFCKRQAAGHVRDQDAVVAAAAAPRREGALHAAPAWGPAQDVGVPWGRGARRAD